MLMHAYNPFLLLVLFNPSIKNFFSLIATCHLIFKTAGWVNVLNHQEFISFGKDTDIRKLYSSTVA